MTRIKTLQLEGTLMSYKCDVCSQEMASKASGKTYRDEDVNTCPGYWEVAAIKQKAFSDLLGGGSPENAYGMFIQQRLQDQSGFTVCPVCAAMLDERSTQLKEIGLERLVAGGVTPREQVLVVAGVVWQRTIGNWPSCLDGSVRAVRDKVIRKWWQFWR
jgi:hypothetical protein